MLLMYLLRHRLCQRLGVDPLQEKGVGWGQVRRRAPILRISRGLCFAHRPPCPTESLSLLLPDGGPRNAC